MADSVFPMQIKGACDSVLHGSKMLDPILNGPGKTNPPPKKILIQKGPVIKANAKSARILSGVW